MENLNRPRWTKSNAAELYISYFDILNSSSGVEYLDEIFRQERYNEFYWEFYAIDTSHYQTQLDCTIQGIATMYRK